MDVLRTPDTCFQNLPDYSFAPKYAEITIKNVPSLRMHYLDEGPRTGTPVLMLHGEPSWSFLYRKVVRVVSAAGMRSIVPDLIGFGRSDKPAAREDYTYERHVAWITQFVESLDLRNVTLLCQDWGGLIGLRVLTENPDRFARVVVANTGLPTGDRPMSDAFLSWQRFSQEVPQFPIGKIVGNGCANSLSADIIAGYDAPFPDESFKAGARQFPLLVPTRSDDPAAPANRHAWEVLAKWNKPFLTAFSDQDPITHGGERVFQKLVPGATDQPHTTVVGAGHFLQEDKGEELGEIVVRWIRAT